MVFIWHWVEFRWGAFEQGSGLCSTGTGQTSVEVSFSTIMDCIPLALGRVQLGAFEQGSGLCSTGTGQTSVEGYRNTVIYSLVPQKTGNFCSG